MIHPRVARELRALGHDADATAERADLRGQDDAVILAVAAREGRVVVTEDRRDFRRLARAEVSGGRPHPALVLLSPRAWRRRNRIAIGRLVRALDALLASGAMVEGEHWLVPPE